MATLIVNETRYELADISTSSEFYVHIKDADEAVAAYTELRGMKAYTYNDKLYADRTVSKITLSEVKGEDATIYVRMRALTATEANEQELNKTRSELQTLKNLVTPIIQSKINATAVKNLQAAYPGLITTEKEKEVSDASE